MTNEHSVLAGRRRLTAIAILIAATTCMTTTSSAAPTAPVAAAVPGAPARLAAGSGTFAFDNWAGPRLTIWYHVPASITASTPVVFVMHGRGRDADRYRDEWAALAEANGFILAVPEFDNARFKGGDAYNRGGFQNADGSIRPRANWTFSAIEPLFDAVKARTGSAVATYAIYGHSAGAQFVHRFALLMPEARFHAAVSANAGAYAMPDLGAAYPFGLRGAPVDEAGLKRALAKPMVVLLGTADNDPGHESLPREPEAMAQGPHRFARGRAFYDSARAKAAALGVRFAWQLRTVEGVGHKNDLMAVAAAPMLGQPSGDAATAR